MAIMSTPFVSNQAVSNDSDAYGTIFALPALAADNRQPACAAPFLGLATDTQITARGGPMTERCKRLWRKLAIVISLGLGAHGAAQAGLVSGNYDPAFGPSLPDLAYGGSYSFTVSDSCVGNTNGFLALGFGACGPGTIAVNTSLTLSSISNPAQSITKNFVLQALGLELINGFVVGFYSLPTPVMTDFMAAPYAGGKGFGLVYLGYAPRLVSLDLCPGCPGGWSNPTTGQLGGFEATVFHTDDNGNGKLGKDALGRDIGYRVTLDGNNYRFAPTSAALAVPEPAGWALVAVALGACLLARRRLGTR